MSDESLNYVTNDNKNSTIDCVEPFSSSNITDNLWKF